MRIPCYLPHHPPHISIDLELGQGSLNKRSPAVFFADFLKIGGGSFHHQLLLMPSSAFLFCCYSTIVIEYIDLWLAEFLVQILVSDLILNVGIAAPHIMCCCRRDCDALPHRLHEHRVRADAHHQRRRASYR